jgi:AAA15 family ATPase/GTPase
MITELELKNFRGFGQLKLTGLGPVNLIVGMNNVGKT